MNLCRCPADLFWLPEVYSEIVWHAGLLLQFLLPEQYRIENF